MTNLMISRTDNKAVIFEGVGTYYFLTNFGMWVKAMCMEVIDLEVKNNRPLIHMDETNVKAFDTCGGAV